MNKKVTIMGLGLHGGGVETTKWLARQGAKVLVTDLKTKKELSPSLNKLKNYKIKYILGKHRRQDFKSADLIIKNPGVPKESPYLKLARKNKIPIETDISLFFRLWPGKIIGITGTKGKSTTATLVYQILKRAGLKVFLAGNIGQSVLKFLNATNSIAVLELSSWQLEDAAHVKRSPDIAVITNIYPDHLDRYKNFKEYIKAKKNIFRFQKMGDYLLLNKDNKITRDFAKESKAKVIFFSSPESSFVKLEHRLEYFYNWKGVNPHTKNFGVGVKFYNDSAATTPEATIFALKKLGNNHKNIILIAGGMDKNLNYKELAKNIKKFVKSLILIPGSASNKISQHLHLEIGFPSGLVEAVKLAKKVARRDDVVLFSPAAASFNLFKNEFDRGRKFKGYVKRIFKKS